uniref:Putative secreted protein n=1 Tax=Desmodus rotundus TaxID=9430 RepID=K9IHL0_DESRO
MFSHFMGCLFFKIYYLFIFREGEGEEKERGRNISVWLPFKCPLLKTWPATQAFALTGNRTYDPLDCRPVLILLSHTSQGLCGLSFYFVDVSIAVQKIFSLIQSHLFFFCFPCWGDIPNKILLGVMSKILLPVFPSRVFIVLGLTLKSLIHFELILVCGLRCYSFIFLHVSVQFSQHHLLNKLSVAHCMFLPFLSNINWL